MEDIQLAQNAMEIHARRDAAEAVAAEYISVIPRAAMHLSQSVMNLLLLTGGNADRALAMVNTREQALQLLDHCGANAVGNDQAMLSAAKRECVGVMEVLLARGASASARNNTPLLYAVHNQHVPSIQLLMNHGATPDSHMAYIAACAGMAETLEVLLRGCDDPDVDLVLRGALVNRQIDVARDLIVDWDATPTAADLKDLDDHDFGRVANMIMIPNARLLHDAALLGDLRTLGEFVPKAEGDVAATAMYAAVMHDKVAVVDWLAQQDRVPLTYDIVNMATRRGNPHILHTLAVNGGIGHMNAAA